MLVLSLRVGKGRMFFHGSQSMIALNLPVYQINPPSRTIGKLLIVGNNYNRLMQLTVQAVKELIDIVCRARIKVTGRLIAKKYFWFVGQCTCNGNPLLLAAGELTWLVGLLVLHINHVEQLHGPLPDLFSASATVDHHRHTDIFDSVELGQQKVKLIDKAYFFIADTVHLRFSFFGNRLSVKPNLTGGWPVKPSHNIKQS